MNIGEAMTAMIGGAKVNRTAWPAGQWLAYAFGNTAAPASQFADSAAVQAYVASLPGGVVALAPSIYLKDPTGGIHHGWAAKEPDLLNTDWQIVP